MGTVRDYVFQMERFQADRKVDLQRIRTRFLEMEIKIANLNANIHAGISDEDRSASFAGIITEAGELSASLAGFEAVSPPESINLDNCAL